MKNKVLYIAPNIVDVNKLSGVPKKMFSQMGILTQKCEGALICYGEDGILRIEDQDIKEVYTYARQHRRFQLYSYALKLVEEGYNCVYIRYSKSDYYFIRLVKKLKSKSCKIVIEIPTYPYDNDKTISLKGKFILQIDKFFRKFLRKYVDLVVTYSDDEIIWGIKTIRTINGIDFYKVHPHNCNNKKTNDITLISVAHYYECHGCDRLIKGISDYYLSGGNRNIYFHIVGDGPSLEGYKKLVKQLRLEKYIFFDGFCTGEKLDALYDCADMAVNSIAIHRMGLIKESTLKSKEYAAKGLPILSSYKIDAFEEDKNEMYVKCVPCDESNIDVGEVVRFLDDLYSKKNVSEVINDVRESARKICDMSVTLKEVVAYFEL